MRPALCIPQSEEMFALQEIREQGQVLLSMGFRYWRIRFRQIRAILSTSEILLIVETEIDNISVPSEVWKTTLCTEHQGFIQETGAH